MEGNYIKEIHPLTQLKTQKMKFACIESLPSRGKAIDLPQVVKLETMEMKIATKLNVKSLQLSLERKNPKE